MKDELAPQRPHIFALEKSITSFIFLQISSKSFLAFIFKGLTGPDPPSLEASARRAGLDRIKGRIYFLSRNTLK